MFLVPFVWCPNCHCCAPSTIYVPCAPVWCPNCHCCAPSTICSLCPCMVSKLSLMCSIYHMFLVPLYGVQTVIAVLHLPYVPCAPVWCPKLSLLCSIYHMFLVPMYGVQPVIAVLHLPYVPCAPYMVPKLSLLCSIYHMFLVPLYDVKLSLLCSIYHMFLVLLYDVKLAMSCSIYHMFLVPLVWCPNCNYCAPSTICSLCPCMVPKLSLLCSIYHMFIVSLYGVQTVIAVLHLPYVPCAPVWCPNSHCCAPSTICSLCPCMVSKQSLLCSICHLFLVPLYGAQTVGAQGTYGRWSTVITVWAPYKGTRNRWQMEHSNDCLDTIQGHNEQMVDGAQQ